MRKTFLRELFLQTCTSLTAWSAQRIENANVLIEGNLIKTVSTSPIDAGGATVIDGGGRTLMPGLIDAHVHLSLNMGFITMYNNCLITLRREPWLKRRTP